MSSFSLKLFAIIFMLIDHIGATFFQSKMIFRIIGRLAFPIFAFQIGIGYSHTKNKKKHILSLLLFAIISQIPFTLMCNIYTQSTTLNVLFTFLFAILIIYCDENIKEWVIKVPLITILLLVATFIKTDYGICGILLTVLFYYFANYKILVFPILIFTMCLFCLANNSSLIQLYAILSGIFILLFNGKKGLNTKWLFYIFYPLHMLLIFVVYKLFS